MVDTFVKLITKHVFEHAVIYSLVWNWATRGVRCCVIKDLKQVSLSGV